MYIYTYKVYCNYLYYNLVYTVPKKLIRFGCGSMMRIQ